MAIRSHLFPHRAAQGFRKHSGKCLNLLISIGNAEQCL